MSTAITANPSRVGSDRENLSFVSFVLGENDYAVNVSEVCGIYHGLSVIPNPDGPAFLEGEILYRNHKVPIVNLRRFAGMSDAQFDRSGRWILMVGDQNGPVGLVVDKVTEVIKLQPNAIEQTTEHVNSPVANYVTAVANHRGRSMLVPDFNRLLHDAIS